MPLQSPTAAPSFADWSERDVPECLTIFQLPAEHRKPVGVANLLERPVREMKRIAQVAMLFPSDAPLLRLIKGVLAEYSGEWETRRKLLTVNP